MRNKFYVVKQGRQPGIYETWAECHQQVNGYPHAVYKSFLSSEEARNYFYNVASEPPAVPLSTRFSMPTPLHHEMQHHVRPFPIPVYYHPPPQVFHPFPPPIPAFGLPTVSMHPMEELPCANGQADSRKHRNQRGKPRAKPYDQTNDRRKLPVVPVSMPVLPDVLSSRPSKTAVAYVDGACSKNGRSGAFAGYGVYFPDSDLRISRPLLPRTQAQTNQRAELMAAIIALEEFPQRHDKDVILTIRTDSTYTINCARDWVHGWKKNGWKTSSGADVQNSDLIVRLHHLCEERRGRLQWEHIRGHSGDVGNEIADRLAVAGAKEAQ